MCNLKYRMAKKLQVSFCKRANTYRALVQKMTHQDRLFYKFSPPYEDERILTEFQEWGHHPKWNQHGRLEPQSKISPQITNLLFSVFEFFLF